MTIDNWGTWDIQTDADMDYGASLGQNTINNWGTFRKTAGSGETVVLADFNNKSGGTLAVDAGSIRIKSNDLVNDRGGTVIIGLDRRLGVDITVTNNGKIQHTQSSTANEFVRDHEQRHHAERQVSGRDHSRCRHGPDDGHGLGQPDLHHSQRRPECGIDRVALFRASTRLPAIAGTTNGHVLLSHRRTQQQR